MPDQEHKILWFDAAIAAIVAIAAWSFGANLPIGLTCGFVAAAGFNVVMAGKNLRARKD